MLRMSLIVIAFLLELQTSSIYADPSNPPRLSVLTYNIHHGQGTDGHFDCPRLARVILDLEPDVVALQEVDRKTTRASGVDQAAHLAELTKMQYAYGCTMHNAGGEYGEVILSRFPIEQVWVHSLPYPFGQEPRTAIAEKSNTFQ
ncbi:endonuclease/exonuclease/phosphatase family protein [Bythopirellula polymerisocia]|uniref:PGAP2IP C-terminal nuclease-like domain-containing protein n=1 Tax=Bythopirellula polymerisocia TaxID=2528003 RepID=A0A5C6C9J0_9BACT|nr:endonuclease/exonuclease/phosphatase family protein [Bythopirellula polymerisocia]TWU21393.1 hypothetical protein Pla144_46140 [Bythopirellula polymerisocia]